MLSLVVVAGLLVMPVYAVQRLGPGFHWLGIYGLVLSALVYMVYALDKRRAEQGSRRIAEMQLHLLELLGGWPGAFLAQRRLRHKCSKASYQVAFWLIVLMYQLAAFDSCLAWRYTKAAASCLQSGLRPRR